MLVPTTSIHEVPEWLRFNKYIHHGYRNGNISIGHAIMSLFSWHNESINVWSHLLPGIMFMYLTWTSEALVPGWYFKSCCAVSCLVFMASVCYHLFMPCCGSKSSYGRLINCDVLSCLLCITVTSFSFIHYGYRCASTSLSIMASILMLISGIVVFVVVLRSRMTAAGRVKLFGFHCMMRLTFAIMFMWPKVVHHGFELSLYYHVTGYFIMMCGGIVNGLRIPERWLPHYFWMDYALNSHNIWHYMCIIAAVSTTMGCVYDHVEFEHTVCD